MTELQVRQHKTEKDETWKHDKSRINAKAQAKLNVRIADWEKHYLNASEMQRPAHQHHKQGSMKK